MEYVDGLTFHALKRQANREVISQAAFSVGETLAAIGRFTFPQSGWLGPGAAVRSLLLEEPDPAPRFVDRCLASENAQIRLASELRERISALMWSHRERFLELDSQACLVHGDFGKRNVLLRCEHGRWLVVAVLDWEFAVSYSPLTDIGHFLRYEHTSYPLLEPHFSEGYLQAGGRLPKRWRRLARVLDLVGLCESLTHDDLPDAPVAELLELVRATVENRDAVIR